VSGRDSGREAAPLELLALVAAGAVGGACALVWASAQVAGRLFGAGGPPVLADDLPAILVRLPEHLADPRRAFPPAAAAALPGPLGFYTALGLILVVTLLAASGTRHLLAGRAPDRGARLAGRGDLRGLVARRPVPGRITLGMIGRRLVIAEARHSLLVIGPPQTGKTTALAIPAILEWPGPVLVTSSKSDVLEATRHARARLGEVMVYDPTGDPGASVGWCPLGESTDWTGAQAAARGLLSAHGPVEGVAESSFWQAAAEMMLAPMLLAAAQAGGMRVLVEWLDAGAEADDDVGQALEASGDPLARSAWFGVRQMEARTRTGVTATARTVLAAWWDPGVLRLARPALTPERLFVGSASLFLVAPAHDQDRLRSVFAGIVSQMTRAVYERRARTGKRLEPGLLVVLDEAAHIAPVRNLPELAATGPEPGIQLVSVFHDAAQIAAAYGRRAPTVAANHRARLYLPGIGDPETLSRLSEALGETEIRRRQSSTGPAGTTHTTTHQRRPLIPAHKLRQMPEGEGLLVYGTRPPARLRLRPWYEDPALRRLARGQG